MIIKPMTQKELALQKEIDKNRALRSLSDHRGDTQHGLGTLLSDREFIAEVFPVAVPVIEREEIQP